MYDCFLQNLIAINDNVYSPQNEVAYNILDAKQEVKLLYYLDCESENYITYVCMYMSKICIPMLNYLVAKT